ncbi:MAG TPA: sn-glycerol-3-phosphate ABC transporter ATP-binding protein UgpC [Magnetospirillaceae bacterium]|jgi:multiple sugar transport system ATP-binding protein
MANVVMSGIRKTYGPVEVLHGLDLSVTDGEFLVLVGPSGCGKSTLLRTIAGLETISAGKVEIGGRDVTTLPPRDRDIAMVFQNYALYPHMSVADNMAFGLKLRKFAKTEIDERVKKAAHILDIDQLLARLPRQLSGGQRQRVAMGRAIVRDPQVFLFDEPLSNLDAKLRVQMRGEIKELHQKLRTTSIYVTHDQIEAMTMADRIVVMRDGWIEQVGNPLDLYDRPANQFVAGFIGSPAMNFIAGKVVRDNGRPAIVTTTGEKLPGEPPASISEGKAIVFGVRPEHFTITTQGQGVPTLVSVVEPTGAETLVVGRVGENTVHVNVKERRGFKPGEQIWLQPQSGTVHLFDAENGRRI